MAAKTFTDDRAEILAFEIEPDPTFTRMERVVSCWRKEMLGDGALASLATYKIERQDDGAVVEQNGFSRLKKDAPEMNEETQSFAEIQTLSQIRDRFAGCANAYCFVLEWNIEAPSAVFQMVILRDPPFRLSKMDRMFGDASDWEKFGSFAFVDEAPTEHLDAWLENFRDLAEDRDSAEEIPCL